MTVNNWRSLPEGKEKYNQYLNSREWGLLKKQVKNRCGNLCERCKLNPVEQIHHLTYIRKYKEAITDLCGLCEMCHKFEHGLSDDDPIFYNTWREQLYRFENYCYKIDYQLLPFDEKMQEFLAGTCSYRIIYSNPLSDLLNDTYYLIEEEDEFHRSLAELWITNNVE